MVQTQSSLIFYNKKNPRLGPKAKGKGVHKISIVHLRFKLSN